MTTVLILFLILLGGAWCLIAFRRSKARGKRIAEQQKRLLSEYPCVYEARCRVCGELTAYRDFAGPVHPSCAKETQ